MRARAVLGTLAAAVVGNALAPAPAPAQPLKAVQVFVAVAQRPEPKAREEYLKDHAGRAVEGAGHVEALTVRTYYDTSVPDSNSSVALIQVSPGRKVVCGLRRSLGREDAQSFAEGTSVAFRGLLSDAHDWGEWTTLYLGDCSLRRR